MNHAFIPAVTPPADRSDPALWFAFAESRLLYSEQSPTVVPLLADISELGLTTLQRHYLGRLKGQHCFAVELDSHTTAPNNFVLNGLRKAYPALGGDLFAVAGRAIQIIDWERTHKFCGRCGAKTVAMDNERAKQCPECKLINFPRLSPAIIVRVNRGPEILLARAPTWPPGRYSVLAGFVEPGETLEQTVEREIFEEVGIRVKNIRYFGSQAWPFPNSLMIAFTAEYAGGEITPDHVEIEDARWFNFDNLPKLSPKMSISRWLIDDFFALAESDT
jgi:NAD+ diphosphatase